MDSGTSVMRIWYQGGSYNITSLFKIKLFYSSSVLLPKNDFKVKVGNSTTEVMKKVLNHFCEVNCELTIRAPLILF